MTGFLEETLIRKRLEVADKRRRAPVAALGAAAATFAGRDFRGAIVGGGIIAELKSKTPTVASFPQSARLIELADTYALGRAAALSVVTDTACFGTSLAFARRARARSGRPLLVQDFVFDPYQIVEAIAHGADAVLLIARILDEPQLTDLVSATHEMGAAALVEVPTRRELDWAIEAGARVVGINNRDLDSLVVSMETTDRLLGAVPEGIVLVTESGISTPDDITALRGRGVDAFLVGGALLAAHRPGVLLSEMVAALSRTSRAPRTGAGRVDPS